MMKSPIYLIPYDFTSASEGALRLGLDLAEANNGSVYLLHIVKKHSEKIQARTQFTEVFTSLTEKEQLITNTKVIVGELYEDVGKAGDILKASLIVMGTHGAQGMQKVFGSHAVKMINSSSTPFLITRGNKTVDKIKTIVMPFSFAKESIQITTFAAAIAKKFNATMHLVGCHDNDEWLEGKTRANQLVVRRALKEMEVDCELVNMAPSKDYNEQVIAYAKEVDADIIAAAYFKESIFPTPNSFIQGMIENEFEIPLLTVNSEELSVINSNFSFMNT
ncbi:MAG: nucleotide-binding universal stress UspA family protein [Crocinitomicaceae bacterium]|jgi:nucleotide-binding universal stress UspA family protein